MCVLRLLFFLPYSVVTLALCSTITPKGGVWETIFGAGVQIQVAGYLTVILSLHTHSHHLKACFLHIFFSICCLFHTKVITQQGTNILL